MTRVDGDSAFNDQIPTLAFRRFDSTEIGSLSVAFVKAAPADLCRIYILRFEDGKSYVGQSLNVVSRYAAHRRRWGDIVAVEFAPCPPEQLDECERRLVSQEEQKGSELRNLMLAGILEDGATSTSMWSRGRL